MDWKTASLFLGSWIYVNWLMMRGQSQAEQDSHTVVFSESSEN